LLIFGRPELASDPDFQYLFAEMMAFARYRLRG
jgi:hypothetical protein